MLTDMEPMSDAQLPVYLRTLDAHSFYALLAAELIAQVPLSEREGAILLLD